MPWERFEDLVLELALDKWSAINGQLLGVRGQGQGGIDFLLDIG